MVPTRAEAAPKGECLWGNAANVSLGAGACTVLLRIRENR